MSRIATMAVLVAACSLGGAQGAPGGSGLGLEWLPSLDEGIAQASKSGRAILVITLWKQAVCASCDDWRKRVLADREVQAAMESYVPVMWLYDGLGGSVIAWTKQHGNTNDDPSVLAWILDPAGNEIAAGTAAMHERSSAIAWLAEHARTSFPLVDPAGYPLLRGQASALAARRKMGATLAELRELAAGGEQVDAAKQAEATRMLAQVDPFLDWRFENAAAAQAKNPPRAVALYQELAAELKGDSLGERAAQTLKDLKKDAAFQGELAAWELLQRAQVLQAEMRPCGKRVLELGTCPDCRRKNDKQVEQAAQLLTALVKKHPDTAAARQATALLSSWNLGK